MYIHVKDLKPRKATGFDLTSNVKRGILSHSSSLTGPLRAIWPYVVEWLILDLGCKCI